ncbi:MAG: hypothetical protein ABUL72_03435, partial [Armatimonadota bacterium]
KSAVKKALAVPQKALDHGIFPGIKGAADAALGIGKQALGDLSTAKAEETEYHLFEEGFEAVGLMKKVKLDYKEVTAIIHKGGDKFWVEHEGGHVTLKPVAHLVAGQQKVAIGWLRNGMEVDYITLVNEIAARCNVGITEE